MTLKFSDGMTFDTSGDFRLELMSDGWYVIGNGTLVAVEDKVAGEALIRILKNLNNEKK